MFQGEGDGGARRNCALVVGRDGGGGAIALVGRGRDGDRAQLRREPPSALECEPGPPAMSYQDRIVADPAICDGQPVIRGARVLLRTVLGYLANGAHASEIVAEFPTITEEDVRAVIAFAAASAGERSGWGMI